MILIHPLKLAYSNIPKLATTSMFEWLYQLLFDKPFDEAAEGTEIHGWFRKQDSDVITALPHRTSPPDGYFAFCIIRDPVKRLISAYRNRVGEHGELRLNRWGMADLLAEGYRADPSLNYFVAHLDAYQYQPSIRHHTKPMAVFAGENRQRFDAIYDIAELPALRDRLVERARDLGVIAPDRQVPAIPRSQTGGPPVGLEALTEPSLNAIIEAYQVDYDLFPGLGRDRITEEWKAARSLYPEVPPPDQVTMTPVVSLAIGKTKLLREPQILPGRDGLLSNFAGFVIVRKSQPDQGRLLFRDADGIGLLPWQPSPGMAGRFPGNPHAANARFVARRLRLSAAEPVTLLWEDPQSRELQPVLSTSAAVGEGAAPYPAVAI